MAADPYRTLGVDRRAGELELRAAYRRLVQLHHPDHNGGSPESAQRFEEVQEAYAEIRRRRSEAPGGRGRGPEPQGAGEPSDPDLEARLRSMEAELRQARSAREAAAAEARRAAAAAQESARPNASRSGDAGQAAQAGRPEHPSDEELGYIRTEDSFSKILADVRDGLLGSLDDKPARQRAADVLEEVAAMLRGEQPPRGGRRP